jgi:hypothetical protein
MIKKTSISLTLRIERFDYESDQLFILITEQNNSSKVYFSGWLTLSEIQNNWDIIARNITCDFKKTLLTEVNRT